MKKKAWVNVSGYCDLKDKKVRVESKASGEVEFDAITTSVCICLVREFFFRETYGCFERRFQQPCKQSKPRRFFL